MLRSLFLLQLSPNLSFSLCLCLVPPISFIDLSLCDGEDDDDGSHGITQDDTRKGKGNTSTSPHNRTNSNRPKKSATITLHQPSSPHLVILLRPVGFDTYTRLLSLYPSPMPLMVILVKAVPHHTTIVQCSESTLFCAKGLLPSPLVSFFSPIFTVYAFVCVCVCGHLPTDQRAADGRFP